MTPMYSRMESILSTNKEGIMITINPPVFNNLFASLATGAFCCMCSSVASNAITSVEISFLHGEILPTIFLLFCRHYKCSLTLSCRVFCGIEFSIRCHAIGRHRSSKFLECKQQLLKNCRQQNIFGR